MEERLIADLRGDAAIIAAAASYNSRPVIDWATRPDLAAMPGAVLSRITIDRLYSQEGPVSLTGARIQVDVYGKTYTSVTALYRAIQDKMEAGGTGWRAFLLSRRDFAPEDAPGGERIFRANGDFNIWYEE